MWRRRRFRLAALAFSTGFLILAGYLIYCLVTLSFNGGLAVAPTPGAMVLTARDGKELAIRGVFKGEKLAFADIPQDVVHALVATEDRRFFEHSGVDWRGSLRALWRDVIAGRAREGGSTITQQLVRMTYLSPERTLRRKVQEAMLALWIEHQLSKQQILADYLNVTYYGSGVYGIDAAAKRYFGKAARDLTLSQSAMLISLLRAPTLLNPHRNLEAARNRADLVLENMVQTRAITREQANEAHRQPASVALPPVASAGYGYFIDAASGEASRLLGMPTADINVATTVDPDMQALAEATVADYLAREGKQKAASQAALVAMAPDGAILAMVGGRDYAESQFNRVTQAQRQPGSLFKLFVYLSALERGFTPESVVVDHPLEIRNWSPENFEGRYFGPVSVRTAFAHSINGIAVQLGQKVGIKAVIETAKTLGIDSKLPDVPSLVLGTADLNLLELVRAYAAVAFNNGILVRPFTVREIRRGDHVVYQQSHSIQPAVVPPQARASMLDLLRAVVSEGTGSAARLLGSEVAGKTGTTQDSRDAWFVGFTPYILVGVWIGNDDHSPTKGVTGGDLPARIWHDFVAKLPAEKLPTLAEGGGRTLTETPPAEPPEALVALTRPEAESSEPLSGDARVIDTGNLVVDGRLVHLLGVNGQSGRAASDLSRYVGHRRVNCEPNPAKPNLYRCTVEGHDLSAAVLFNGAGRATPDATPDLVAAESEARAAARGIWTNP
jgi:1A family penicillin-binding protein